MYAHSFQSEQASRYCLIIFLCFPTGRDMRSFLMAKKKRCCVSRIKVAACCFLQETFPNRVLLVEKP